MNIHDKLISSLLLNKRASQMMSAPPTSRERNVGLNNNWAAPFGGANFNRRLEQADPDALARSVPLDPYGVLSGSKKETPAAPAKAAPQARQVKMPKPGGAGNSMDANALFRKFMGSAFDPNSGMDKAKMQHLQKLMASGGPINAKSVYDRSKGYRW